MRCEPIDAPIGARAPNQLACRICGCTDDRACPGGCSWISREPPLCSSCVGAEDFAEFSGQVEFENETGLYGAERCPASATPALHMPIYVDETSGYCVRCRQGFVT